ncbi:MAG: hypothetical protein WCP98_14410 [Actinomycetes bacterium]
MKALGLLFCQQALCLNAELRELPLESCIGQRLTARPWALLDFWSISGGMPYTDYLDQTGIIIESVYDSTGRDDHLVQILLIELRNDSSHARMILKHFNPGHNSVAKMFSPLRAIFRNIFYKAP